MTKRNPLYQRFGAASDKTPVFLIGCHKSGTSLLRALLDGHPDLTVHPKETHFFTNLGGWHRYPLSKRCVSRTEEKRYAAFIAHVRERAALADPYSDSPDFKGYSEVRFAAEFPPTALDGVADSFNRYLYALDKSCSGNCCENVLKRLVEKTVENHEHIGLIRAAFPKAKLLHIIRHPYAVMHSSNKALRPYFPYLNRIVSIAKACRDSLGIAWNLSSYDEQHLVMRYETLVASPESEMRRVAEFLEVDYQDSLCLPTENGLPWGGNSSTGIRKAGLTADRVDAWKGELAPIETWVVNRIGSEMAGAWDYELEPTPNRWRMLCRGRYEPLRDYVSNRIALASLSRHQLFF